MREWIKSGAAVEEIRNDYGEDLLIQTSLHEGMDESRLWVQVKGKESVRISTKTGNPASIQVSRSHAIRWVRATEVTVVTLWDVSRDIGWYAIPKDQLHYTHLLMSASKQVNIKFYKDAIFNARAADKLAWRSRIQHVNQLLLQSIESQNWARENDIEEIAKQAHGEIKAIAFEFLIRVGLLQQNGVPSTDFTDQLKETLESSRSSTKATPLTFESAVLLRIMLFLQERQGSGDTMPLIGVLAYIMILIYREAAKPDFVFHPAHQSENAWDEQPWW
ncbi:DUF4365 domain-containing protein [[Kitasatospora] papulosa]|uniref:DUF4365 domain-containing protein n=1 Tax=[Kitasatospora] papulosa TaxID=1464011 RepID=UPI0035D927A6